MKFAVHHYQDRINEANQMKDRYIQNNSKFKFNNYCVYGRVDLDLRNDLMFGCKFRHKSFICTPRSE